MTRLFELRLAAFALPVISLLGLSGCGSEAEALSVANKQECLVEVSKRLLACSEESECEAGVSRFAGYCYNTAQGDQLDICRGGDYFFQRPLAEATRDHPEVAQLNSRQREIIIRTGDIYCNFNYN
ncbi:MAG: hypothetical protein OEQ25_14055 [Gammaproteobacteria bacterium]|nr:hypothetical protein [Gammaproteobacteria bacterium]MDH3508253.1 hypothetical protein [Gammaproteobacteria bacterium]